MFMAKSKSIKAQGLSINTIIIAALGLAVLVILFAVFTGRIGLFNKAVSGADTCEQKCIGLGKTTKIPVTSADGCRGEQGTAVAGSYADAPDGICCCK